MKKKLRVAGYARVSTDALKKFLNSGWENIYHGMTRENKRTLWRNLIKEIHITDHGYEIIFL